MIYFVSPAEPAAAPQVTPGGFSIEENPDGTKNVTVYWKVSLRMYYIVCLDPIL